MQATDKIKSYRREIEKSLNLNTEQRSVVKIDQDLVSKCKFHILVPLDFANDRNFQIYFVSNDEANCHGRLEVSQFDFGLYECSSGTWNESKLNNV